MIAALVELDANGLCLQWRNHLGGTPPAHLPRWLLVKILAYRIQARPFGGLDKETPEAGQAAPGALRCQFNQWVHRRESRTAWKLAFIL
jgi:hypothetical protein